MDEIIKDILEKMAVFREQLRNNTFNREILADLDLLTQYFKDDIGGRLILERDTCNVKIQNELEGQRKKIIGLETAHAEFEKRLAEKEARLRDSEDRFSKNELEWDKIDRQRKKDLATLSDEMMQMEETIVGLKTEQEKNKRLKVELEAAAQSARNDLENRKKEIELRLKEAAAEKEAAEQKFREKSEAVDELNGKISELMRKIEHLATQAVEREKKLQVNYAAREKEFTAAWNKSIAAREKKYQELIEENAAGISLRLRSCINSVSGVIQNTSDKLLVIKNKKQAPGEEEALRKDLADTLVETNTIAKAVKAYLDLSKTPLINITEINIYEKIKKTFNYYVERIEKQNIKVVFNHEDLLQKCFGDEETMLVIFNDIIQNAVEAMPNGGTLTVSTNSVVVGQNKYLRVAISDTGVGIDPRINDKIFLPFFTTKEFGEGMGLARVKRNMILNKGSIVIESKREQGTTVNLTFYKGKVDA